MQKKPLRNALLLLAPFLLILVGYFCFSRWQAASQVLQPDHTYTVWVSEVEVAPAKPDGTAWDIDNSAPDIRCELFWQKQLILKTVAGRDSLITRFDPVGVDVGQVMHGEVSAASVQRVAHVRLAPNEPLTLCAFDEDIGFDEFVGGFTVPLESLRLGCNEVRSDNSLRRVLIEVSEDAPAASQKPSHLVEGVEWLKSPPELPNQTDQISSEAKKLFDRVRQQFK